LPAQRDWQGGAHQGAEGRAEVHSGGREGQTSRVPDASSDQPPSDAPPPAEPPEAPTARPAKSRARRSRWSDVERAVRAAHGPLVAGIDEVGRGPLAGPVVACAVVMPPDARAVGGVDDSKRLTSAQ